MNLCVEFIPSNAIIFTLIRIVSNNTSGRLKVQWSPIIVRVQSFLEAYDHALTSYAKGMTIDKDAANRFIKHAISQVTYSSSNTPGEAASSSAGVNTRITFDDDGKPVPTRVTEKMRERERYEAALREEGSEEEDEELAIIDDIPHENEAVEPEEESSKAAVSAKGKDVASHMEEDTSQPGRKRRRPMIDPFGGEFLAAFTQGKHSPSGPRLWG